MRQSGGDGGLTDVVCIFADGRDWHVRELIAGLERRGVGSVICPLEKVPIAIGCGAGDPLAIPGLDGRLPRAAFVRTISAGSFEAVTLRLGLLHGLEQAGVRIVNRPRAIELCVDKSATSLVIARAGLPTPPTFVTERPEVAAEQVQREAAAGHAMIWKPLFGAQGKGLRMVRSAEDLPSPEEAQGVYYLQRFQPPADGAFRDYRLLVSGDHVVAAMRRRSESWITNVHQGGTPEAFAPDAAASALALAAARAVGADFAGVDLIEDGAGGYLVLEVNSMPAWSGLQSVTELRIGDRLAADLVAVAGFAGGAG